MVRVPKLLRPDARGVFVDEQRSFAAFVNEVARDAGMRRLRRLDLDLVATPRALSAGPSPSHWHRPVEPTQLESCARGTATAVSTATVSTATVSEV